MTDEKVQELAGRYTAEAFCYRLGAPVTPEIVGQFMLTATRLAYRAAVEEAAKIVKEMNAELEILKNSVGDTERGRGLQKGVWAMFAAQLKILGLTDVPPAAPSSSENDGVVAARKSKSTDYLAGEKAGLEEAAKIAEGLYDKTYWDDPSAGIAAEIRKLGEKA